MARTRSVSVSSAAARRVDALHAALVATEAPPAGLPALVGFYMDCHIPAIGWKGDVCSLYVANHAPEDSHADAVGCYPVCVHAESAVKAWHSQLHHEVTDVAAKLLRKGGPTPSSVRYVSGLLTRCAQKGASTQPLIRAMILSHCLGNYRHSAACAGRVRRVHLYRMPVPELCAMVCNSMTTKELHGMLTEFVASTTLRHQALLKSIGVVSGRSIANPALAHFSGDLTRAHTVPLGYSVFSVMLKAMNVHHTTLTASRPHLEDDHIDRIMQTAVCAPAFASTTAVLRRMGVEKADAVRVRRCFTERKLGTLKMMRLVLKQMAPLSAKIMALYLWAVRQALSVSVGVLHQRVNVMQARLASRTGVSPSVVVCLVCAAIKTPVEGIKMPKTKTGVAVDPTSGDVVCNACSRPHVMQVDMIGRSVTTGSLTRGNRKTVVSCTACGRLTCDHRTLGLYPLCMACFPRARADIFSPQTCFCGRDSARNEPWTAARCGADLSVFAMCEEHRHLRLDTLVNVDSLIQEADRS